MRCDARLWRNRHYADCQCEAKVERGGKNFCGIHDPEKVAARRLKTEARWAAECIERDARCAANTAARKRAELCVAACSTLTDVGVSELGRLLSAAHGYPQGTLSNQQS